MLQIKYKAWVTEEEANKSYDNSATTSFKKNKDKKKKKEFKQLGLNRIKINQNL